MFALANYSAMSHVTLFATLLAAVVSMFFVPAAFIEHKNLVLEILSLAPGSHVTTDNAFTI